LVDGRQDRLDHGRCRTGRGEFLLSNGYVVHELKRRSSSFITGRIDHLYADPHDSNARLFLHYGEMTDATTELTPWQKSLAGANVLRDAS
jgi:GDP-D-mannose dehydratase